MFHALISTASDFNYLILPALFICGGVTIAIVAIYFHFQKQKLWNETVRLALEKGQPIPVPLPHDISVPQNPGNVDGRYSRGRFRYPMHDLRRGLILLAIGFGLALGATNHFSHPQWGTASFILILLGAAMVLTALVTAVFNRGPRPPQS